MIRISTDRRTAKGVRLTAATLAALVFTTQVAFAHKPQTAVWQERRRTAQLAAATGATMAPGQGSAIRSILSSMPKTSALARTNGAGAANLPGIDILPPDFFGLFTVRDARRGSPSRTVVLIEDVHRNSEAQGKISRTLTAIGSAAGEKPVLVGLEGAEGGFRFADFHAFDEADARLVADQHLNDLSLSGPAHAGFTLRKTAGARGLAFTGLEDRTLYAENLAAYRAWSAQKATAIRAIEARSAEAETRKRAAFNDRLRSFDMLTHAYRGGKTTLAVFISRLREEGARMTPQMTAFADAAAMEGRLDFARIEAERVEALKMLVARMPQAEIEGLVGTTIAAREGRLSMGAYYALLRARLTKAGVALARLPAFDAYLRYVALADTVRAETLFADVEAAEADVTARLAKTPAEQALARESRALSLARKLCDFTLTPREWAAHQKGRDILAGINLSAAESFYRAADARSAAIVRGLSATMKGGLHARTAVVVSGGFHSREIATLLEREGWSYLIASPKLSKIDLANASAYLSVFDREKTPLERIFMDSKLYLADAVTGAVNPLLPDTLTPRMGVEALASAASRQNGDTAGATAAARRLGAEADVESTSRTGDATDVRLRVNGRPLSAKVTRSGVELTARRAGAIDPQALFATAAGGATTMLSVISPILGIAIMIGLITAAVIILIWRQFYPHNQVMTRHERALMRRHGQIVSDFLADRSIGSSHIDRTPLRVFEDAPASDLIVVFGNGHGLVADRAADMFAVAYKKNKNVRIVFTGGVGRATPDEWQNEGLSESQAMANIFYKRLALIWNTTEDEVRRIIPGQAWAKSDGAPRPSPLTGVDNPKLIMETSSTNSGANVANTTSILAQLGFAPKNIVLVSSPALQKRSALATWLKQSGITDAEVVSYAPFLYDFTRLDNEAIFPLALFMAGEMKRLVDYAAAGGPGYTVPFAVPENIQASLDVMNRIIDTVRKREAHKAHVLPKEEVISKLVDFGRDEHKFELLGIAGRRGSMPSVILFSHWAAAMLPLIGFAVVGLPITLSSQDVIILVVIIAAFIGLFILGRMNARPKGVPARDEERILREHGQKVLDFLSDRSIGVTNDARTDLERLVDGPAPDVMMAFGSGNELVARRLAHMFHAMSEKNPKMHVIFSGGTGGGTPQAWRDAGLSEARAYEQIFMETLARLRGETVDAVRAALNGRIHLDETSSNTGANSVNSNAIINDLVARGVIEKPKTILLTIIPVSQKRGLATWLKQSSQSGATVISYAPYRYDMSRVDVRDLVGLGALLRGEMARLVQYAGTFAEPTDIPADVAASLALVLRTLDVIQDRAAAVGQTVEADKELSRRTDFGVREAKPEMLGERVRRRSTMAFSFAPIAVLSMMTGEYEALALIALSLLLLSIPVIGYYLQRRQKKSVTDQGQRRDIDSNARPSVNLSTDGWQDRLDTAIRALAADNDTRGIARLVDAIGTLSLSQREQVLLRVIDQDYRFNDDVRIRTVSYEIARQTGYLASLIERVNLRATGPPPASAAVRFSIAALIGAHVPAALRALGLTGNGDKNAIDKMGKDVAKALFHLTDTRGFFTASEGLGRDAENDGLTKDDALGVEVVNPNGTRTIHISVDVVENTNATAKDDKRLPSLQEHQGGGTSPAVTGRLVRAFGNTPDCYADVIVTNVPAEKSGQFADLDPMIDDAPRPGETYAQTVARVAETMKALYQRIADANGLTLADLEILAIKRTEDTPKDGMREKTRVDALKKLSAETGLTYTLISDGTLDNGIRAAIGRREGKHLVFHSTSGAPEASQKVAYAAALKGQGAIAAARLYTKRLNSSDADAAKAKKKDAINLASRFMWSSEEKQEIRDYRAADGDAEDIIEGRKVFRSAELVPAEDTFNTDDRQEPLFDGGSGSITDSGTSRVEGAKDLGDGRFVVYIRRVVTDDEGRPYWYIDPVVISKPLTDAPEQNDRFDRAVPDLNAANWEPALTALIRTLADLRAQGRNADTAPLAAAIRALAGTRRHTDVIHRLIRQDLRFHDSASVREIVFDVLAKAGHFDELNNRVNLRPGELPPAAAAARFSIATLIGAHVPAALRALGLTGNGDKNAIDRMGKDVAKLLFYLYDVTGRFTASEGLGRDAENDGLTADDALGVEIVNADAGRSVHIAVDVVENTNATAKDDRRLADLKEHQGGGTSPAVTGRLVRAFGNVPDSYADVIVTNVPADKAADFADLDPMVDDSPRANETYDDTVTRVADTLRALYTRVAQANGLSLADIEVVAIRRTRETPKDGMREQTRIDALNRLAAQFGLTVTLISDGTLDNGIRAAIGRRNGKHLIFHSTSGAPEAAQKIAYAAAFKKKGAIAAARLYTKRLNSSSPETATAKQKDAINLASRFMWSDEEKQEIRSYREANNDADAIINGTKVFRSLKLEAAEDTFNDDDKKEPFFDGASGSITDSGTSRVEGAKDLGNGSYIVYVRRVVTDDEGNAFWFIDSFIIDRPLKDAATESADMERKKSAGSTTLNSFSLLAIGLMLIQSDSVTLGTYIFLSGLAFALVGGLRMSASSQGDDNTGTGGTRRLDTPARADASDTPATPTGRGGDTDVPATTRTGFGNPDWDSRLARDIMRLIAMPGDPARSSFYERLLAEIHAAPAEGRRAAYMAALSLALVRDGDLRSMAFTLLTDLGHMNLMYGQRGWTAGATLPERAEAGAWIHSNELKILFTLMGSDREPADAEALARHFADRIPQMRDAVGADTWNAFEPPVFTPESVRGAEYHLLRAERVTQALESDGWARHLSALLSAVPREYGSMHDELENFEQGVRGLSPERSSQVRDIIASMMGSDAFSPGVREFLRDQLANIWNSTEGRVNGRLHGDALGDPRGFLRGMVALIMEDTLILPNLPDFRETRAADGFSTRLEAATPSGPVVIEIRLTGETWEAVIQSGNNEMVRLLEPTLRGAENRLYLRRTHEIAIQGGDNAVERVLEALYGTRRPPATATATRQLRSIRPFDAAWMPLSTYRIDILYGRKPNEVTLRFVDTERGSEMGRLFLSMKGGRLAIDTEIIPGYQYASGLYDTSPGIDTLARQHLAEALPSAFVSLLLDEGIAVREAGDDDIGNLLAVKAELVIDYGRDLPGQSGPFGNRGGFITLPALIALSMPAMAGLAYISLPAFMGILLVLATLIAVGMMSRMSGDDSLNPLGRPRSPEGPEIRLTPASFDSDKWVTDLQEDLVAAWELRQTNRETEADARMTRLEAVLRSQIGKPGMDEVCVLLAAMGNSTARIMTITHGMDVDKLIADAGETALVRKVRQLGGPDFRHLDTVPMGILLTSMPVALPRALDEYRVQRLNRDVTPRSPAAVQTVDDSIPTLNLTLFQGDEMGWVDALVEDVAYLSTQRDFARHRRFRLLIGVLGMALLKYPGQTENIRRALDGTLIIHLDREDETGSPATGSAVMQEIWRAPFLRGMPKSNRARTAIVRSAVEMGLGDNAAAWPADRMGAILKNAIRRYEELYYRATAHLLTQSIGRLNGRDVSGTELLDQFPRLVERNKITVWAALQIQLRQDPDSPTGRRIRETLDRLAQHMPPVLAADVNDAVADLPLPAEPSIDDLEAMYRTVSARIAAAVATREALMSPVESLHEDVAAGARIITQPRHFIGDEWIEKVIRDMVEITRLEETDGLEAIARTEALLALIEAQRDEDNFPEILSFLIGIGYVGQLAPTRIGDRLMELGVKRDKANLRRQLIDADENPLHQLIDDSDLENARPIDDAWVDATIARARKAIADVRTMIANDEIDLRSSREQEDRAAGNDFLRRIFGALNADDGDDGDIDPDDDFEDPLDDNPDRPGFVTLPLLAVLAVPGMVVLAFVSLPAFAWALAILTVAAVIAWWVARNRRPATRSRVVPTGTPADLSAISDDVLQQASRALGGQKTSLAMLKTFAEFPRGSEEGVFVTAEFGGTNGRVYIWRVENGAFKMILPKPLEFAFTDAQKADPTQAFEALAAEVKKGLTESGASLDKPVGFVFAFPTRLDGPEEAVLTLWSKGWKENSARPVLNRNVTDIFKTALARQGIADARVLVANDTVDPMMTATFEDRANDPSATPALISMILGTGHNIAVAIRRADGSHDIRNVESGNFDGIQLLATDADRELDRASTNPGEHLFEKMTSGAYLGEVVRLTMRGFARASRLFSTPYALKSEHLSLMLSEPEGRADDADGQPKLKALLEQNGISSTIEERILLRRTAEATVRRSARLIAAMLAGAIRVVDPDNREPRYLIPVEGSLFWGTPNYQALVTEALRDTLGDRAAKVEFRSNKGKNGVGIALMAATYHAALNAVAPQPRREKRREGKVEVDALVAFSAVALGAGAFVLGGAAAGIPMVIALTLAGGALLAARIVMSRRAAARERARVEAEARLLAGRAQLLREQTLRDSRSAMTAQMLADILPVDKLGLANVTGANLEQALRAELDRLADPSLNEGERAVGFVMLTAYLESLGAVSPKNSVTVVDLRITPPAQLRDAVERVRRRNAEGGTASDIIVLFAPDTDGALRSEAARLLAGLEGHGVALDLADIPEENGVRSYNDLLEVASRRGRLPAVRAMARGELDGARLEIFGQSPDFRANGRLAAVMAILINLGAGWAPVPLDVTLRAAQIASQNA